MQEHGNFIDMTLNKPICICRLLKNQFAKILWCNYSYLCNHSVVLHFLLIANAQRIIARKVCRFAY